ncbi:hypothetical protein GDO86_012574 [Hymenochirus boettgeri]|uniref:AJAP1/PANP C-terminal domain-containing protein n=1 Tax=Hymenochirus boettgeri TaxID=247094 RepID=A0A8T2IT29_9PIPI|nr:hypothetical protein GDO86_012574 [Hymenochirus boettgeri]
MWINQLLGIRSGHPLGSHAWILIAMIQLAMDFIICESGSPSKAYKHLQRPSLVHRIHHFALWSPTERQKLRNQKHFWNPFTNYGRHFQTEQKHSKIYHRDHAESTFFSNAPSQYSTTEKLHSSTQELKDKVRMTDLKRNKRQLQSRSSDNLKRVLDSESQTTVSEFILWGPTGDDDFGESSTLPGFYETTRTSTFQARTTLLETTTTTTTSTTTQPKIITSLNPGIRTGKKNPGRISTVEPYPGNGKDIRPPRIPSETSECCAQSGNARHNSHQRKINQQEESCQNLTDFTPARVPSNMDIFTAYNETLQCSHECVRTPVPVYTDEDLHQPAAFKTTFNGNR